MRSSRTRPWVAECERLTPWSGDHKSSPCFLVSFSIAWEWDLAFLQNLSQVHCPMYRCYSLLSLTERKGRFCLTHCCSLKRKDQSVRIGKYFLPITNLWRRGSSFTVSLPSTFISKSLPLPFLLKRLPRMPTNDILLGVSLQWTSIPNRKKQSHQLLKLNLNYGWEEVHSMH